MNTARQDLAPLMQRFESIGNSCEFGFVQRHFGADPVSLFRWASSSIDGLARGLEDGFATLFEMDNLSAGWGPSLVIDRVYDLALHGDLAFDETGLVQNEANLAAYRRYARVTHHRRRLFSETLRKRNRIFIYSTYADADIADLLRLKAALDLHGPQRLLYVVPASAGHPAQRVHRVASGVKIAGMVRTTDSFPADAIDFSAWADICAQAVQPDWGQGDASAAEGPSPPTSNPTELTEWHLLLKRFFSRQNT